MSLCHKSQVAAVRQGAHVSGSLAPRPVISSALRSPKSVCAQTSGRFNPKISTMSAVHGPTPLTAVSLERTAMSSSDSRACAVKLPSTYFARWRQELPPWLAKGPEREVFQRSFQPGQRQRCRLCRLQTRKPPAPFFSNSRIDLLAAHGANIGVEKIFTGNQPLPRRFATGFKEISLARESLERLVPPGDDCHNRHVKMLLTTPG